MASAQPQTQSPPLLELSSVRKTYGSGWRRSGTSVLDDVSFALRGDRSSITTIAGESGSGKTTISRLALGLLRPSAGGVAYRGEDVRSWMGRRRLDFRRQVQAILQDPYDVYNPFYRVDHVFDVLLRRFRLADSVEQGRDLVEQALRAVGLEPSSTLGRYPHELSGGQAQRLMVARAFLLRPRLVIADEPVSMVDASLRATILESMVQLRETLGVSFLYITHDLATAYHLSDEILILHEGRIVERGSTRSVIDAPQHPYTRLLIDSIPEPDPDHRWRPIDEVASAGPPEMAQAVMAT